MIKRILIDKRWDGDTGIGKLYREVMARMPVHVVPSFIQVEVGLGNMLTPVILANEIRKTPADVFYSPSFMPPLYSRIPFVLTIHDLMHLFYYTKWHRIYYKQVIARCAAKAKQIITVSHFSKQQLIELLGLPDHLITVIYNGVDENFRENTVAYFSGRPYFLYVGNRRKNKNLLAMLSAFARAVIPDEFMFFLSGETEPALAVHIGKLGIAHRVRFLGYIPEQDLPALYKGAFATLYVSLMEGFGLPVIESMASGTPVITASTSALPEISGGAALCVDPKNVSAITHGIETLVNEKTIYQHYVQLGYHRAAEFSWDKTAMKTWDTILATP
ncbi:glycosyltransferase family 4 protein [Parapedobacter lycopersici]|uniref:glycosyltransferase family 4 protein n=1 Tax=Parapedobacter lycopersici TaxID=1864939 RepID=UPI00214D5E7D|nr:glycosyltransferase family 1 protein [Parapedobacter lycopersici]